MKVVLLERVENLGAIDPAGARMALAAPSTRHDPLVDGKLIVEDGLSLGADSWAMLSRLERAGQPVEVSTDGLVCPALPAVEAWIEPLTSLAQRLRERGGSVSTAAARSCRSKEARSTRGRGAWT
mgnify:CR=1 FL=1